MLAFGRWRQDMKRLSQLGDPKGEVSRVTTWDEKIKIKSW